MHDKTIKKYSRLDKKHRFSNKKKKLYKVNVDNSWNIEWSSKRKGIDNQFENVNKYLIIQSFALVGVKSIEFRTFYFHLLVRGVKDINHHVRADRS